MPSVPPRKLRSPGRRLGSCPQCGPSHPYAIVVMIGAGHLGCSVPDCGWRGAYVEALDNDDAIKAARS